MSLTYKMEASRACEAARNLLYSGMGRYNNSYPYNCAYNGKYSNGGKYISGDCWNMFPKCLYWGEALGKPVDVWRSEGSYISPADGMSATGLPDCTGGRIISEFCDNVSTDFSELIPGELLYINSYHMGLYVGELGEWTYSGKTYNVIEFTADSVLGSGCRASYIDEYGRRYSIDRVRSGSWTHHGRFKGFTYSNETKYLPPLYEFVKAMSGEGLFEGLVKGNGNYWSNTWLQYVLKYAGYYTGRIDGDYGSLTYNAVLAFQKDNGLYPDGEFGSKSLYAILCKYYNKEEN